MSLRSPVWMNVQNGTLSGLRLRLWSRLKGHTIQPAAGTQGDRFAHLKIVLPKEDDSEMKDLARRWRDAFHHARRIDEALDEYGQNTPYFASSACSNTVIIGHGLRPDGGGRGLFGTNIEMTRL